jgi:glutathione S-transferase
MTQIDPPYELYYWPSLQGRGEFIRLALEDTQTPYIDVARQPQSAGGGIPAILALLRGDRTGLRPLIGNIVLAQVANILMFLGPRLGLAPTDEVGRAAVNQLQLTLADLVAEVHDTHHPISTGMYYEDQKPEAMRRSAGFREQRMPKFLGYFEDALNRNTAGEGKYLVSDQRTYVDLSMFQVLTGLEYAFPKAYKRIIATTPKLAALRENIAARPNIAAYLASTRRLANNESDIFRNYPELDDG